MHGFGHSSGFGGGEYFGGGSAPGETVINNYYDEPGRQGESRNFDDTGLGNSGQDAADLQQASDDLRDDDQSDTSVDDTSYDDSSSGNDDIA